MRYVTRVLQPGETLVYATRLHWIIFFRAILWLAISIILAIAGWYIGDNRNLSLALYVAAVIFALLAVARGFRRFIDWATTELAVTDRRVIYKTGFIRRHTIEMNRRQIESVDVDQAIPGRIIGYGTVIVRGTGGSLEPMRYIGSPLTFRTYITAA